MKRLSSLLFVLALSATAHAQSYLIKSNGVVLTVDQQGNLYDRSQFILPYMIRYKGGQFYVHDNRQITTVDDGGYYYRIDPSIEAPKEVRFSGLNYFIEKDGTAWTIDRQGTLLKSDGDKAYKKPLVTGGTYFVVEGKKRNDPARLFVVTDRGNIVEMTVPGLDPATIKDGGNSWFVTNAGMVYTVSREGFIYNKSDIIRTRNNIQTKGGNFFVVGGYIYTVAEDGLLMNQGIMSYFGVVAKVGHNYFLTRDAKFFAIDNTGKVINRTENHDLADIALTTF